MKTIENALAQQKSTEHTPGDKSKTKVKRQRRGRETRRRKQTPPTGNEMSRETETVQ
jgi:hypothetical protein